MLKKNFTNHILAQTWTHLYAVIKLIEMKLCWIASVVKNHWKINFLIIDKVNWMGMDLTTSETSFKMSGKYHVYKWLFIFRFIGECIAIYMYCILNLKYFGQCPLSDENWKCSCTLQTAPNTGWQHHRWAQCTVEGKKQKKGRIISLR